MTSRWKQTEYLSKSTSNLSKITSLGSTPNLREHHHEHLHHHAADAYISSSARITPFGYNARHRRVSTGGQFRSTLLTSQSAMSSGSNSASSTRPQSLRSRASSAASSVLDSSQIHMLLNKRDSRSSIFTNSSQDQASPTSTSSATEIRSETSKPHIITVRSRGSLSSEANTMVECSTSTADSEVIRKDSGEQEVSKPLKKLERNQTAPNIPFLNETIWQIDELVYVGTIESSRNMSLLCRLGIEYILDVSHQKSEDEPKNSSIWQCSCRTRHSRYEVNMVVPDSEKLLIDPITQHKMNMNERFDQFIEMIAKARKAKRSVLVCSGKARNKAPAFAAAHLMQNERLTRAAAVQKVAHAMSSMRPNMCISDFLQRSLMRYQVYLGISPDTAHDPTHTMPLFHVKRTAWT
ncbi:unnamed protein product [Auanema sp. JU1783]|nr:unnamed protein product [Auanema sp. JU1783]